MKAIRVHQFGGPEVLKLEEVPDLQPGAGQVVVRMRAVGVNPVDAYMRAGTYPRKPALPYTPGQDGAGGIESIGPAATTGEPLKFKRSDRVYIAGSLSGAYAEQSLCDARLIFPLPADISFAQGAAMNVPYSTAFRALFHKAQARGGETVLIHGASGSVGSAAVQLARAAGLYIVGTVGSDRGRKLVLDEGAHEVLDHKSDKHFDQALALTGGRGFDVIIEMLANVNMGRDLPILAQRGRLVVVGNRGTSEIDARQTMTKDAVIYGMSMWNASTEDVISIHSALVAGLENKTLRPVVNQEIPLAEAARAHVAVMAGDAHGKIVLIP
ncbi:MAG TPA: NADPH:quinone reductase [Candidatus Acidoferrales bacterium]|nr:NADPH:quinone reductase [Candidatus Acidoferrales bacterium]